MWAIFITGLAICIVIMMVITAIYLAKTFASELNKLNRDLSVLSENYLNYLIDVQKNQKRIQEEIKIKDC